MEVIKLENGLYLDDLLQICENNKNKLIILKIGNDLVPLQNGHYIVDEVWYNEVNMNNVNIMQGIDFICECEDEALEDSWGDLYQAPMQQLGNCEVVFTKKYDSNNNYVVEEIKIDEIEHSIIISLKGEDK